MLYLVMTLFALQSLVFPSMNSTLSRTVAPSEQGELQGGVASLQSVSAILGPPILTGAFAHFSRPDAALRFPGAPYVLAAGLTACAIAIVALFARGVFARPAAVSHIGPAGGAGHASAEHGSGAAGEEAPPAPAGMAGGDGA
jgi:MFS family permease